MGHLLHITAVVCTTQFMSTSNGECGWNVGGVIRTVPLTWKSKASSVEVSHSPRWAETVPSRLADSKPDTAAAATAAALMSAPVRLLFSLPYPLADF